MSPGQIIYEAMYPRWGDLSESDKRKWNGARRAVLSDFAGIVEAKYEDALRRALPDVQKEIRDAEKEVAS